MLSAAAMLVVAACAASPAPRLAAADQSEVDRVQAWFDGVHGFRADFLQIWPDGAIGEGVARYDPPGRLRLDYLPSGGMTLVARDGHVVVTDARSGSVTRMRAAASPLGLLLDGRVRLSGDVQVTDVQRSAGALQISLARAGNPGAGLLTLTFADRPGASLVLTGITAVDAERRTTRFRLTHETTGTAFPPGTFSAS